jgi:integrase
MSPVWHQKHWTAARRAVGAEAVHFHDLRHTAGTLAAQHGATLAELKRLLGHSSVRAALRYQHAAEARLKAIAESVGAEIEAELSRGPRGVRPLPAPSERPA